ISELAGIDKKKARLDEADPRRLASLRTSGAYTRPGSPAQAKAASKAGRQIDQGEITMGLDEPGYDPKELERQDAGIQGDAPYAIVWHGQYRENYGAHQWDGQGEAPQHWKNKGDAGKVLAKNIPDWQTAEKLLGELSQTDRSHYDDYSEIHADEPEVIPMSELGKHFYGYDPEMQEHGAKPEQDDAKDVIDMTNEPKKILVRILIQKMVVMLILGHMVEE
ncbi:hypothetical protein LCGC14_1870980, partial [marine sediment metagenome]